MEFECLTLEIDENVAFLTLNQPRNLNAISLKMIREMRSALNGIEDTVSGARCLLITGAGKGFCVGADLSDPEMKMGEAPSKKKPNVLKDYYDPLFLRLRGLNIPIVTAVNGPAAGVGVSLALMGDMILAARSSFFLHAFRQIGLIPDGGCTFLLPRLVGWARAREMSLMGERLSVEKALEWGMINRVCDNDRLNSEARELAVDLAKGPTVAFRLIRQAYWKSMDNDYEAQLRLESEYQKVATGTEDYKEGVAAFLEKRPAHFRGR